ncbi:hypothetical protein IAQ61_000901 [Plenodomus lingam]|uniref:uncharacterized protein n=1 Tax=Leptosphaeria maculans TaxID=5022 RepID=UPI00332E4020|nr:hypothetical protein IAQ61_000901 [Plenodomus lingam]
MTASLTIVVNGANRRLGRGIVQLLASTKHPRPLHIHATSRSGTNLDITPSHANTISYSTLDICSPTSISTSLQTMLKSNTAIEILINNAGV